MKDLCSKMLVVFWGTLCLCFEFMSKHKQEFLLLGRLVEKIYSFAASIVCILLSQDRNFTTKKKTDAALVELSNDKITVIFIRHGESTWNEIFNKGAAKILPRLASGILQEIKMFATSDSIFLDSPLNKEGICQVEGIKQFLETQGAQNIQSEGDTHSGTSLSAFQQTVYRRAMQSLLGYDTRSIVATSNLRRAVATILVGLRGRLSRTLEPVFVLSSAQEISRNPDTLSMTPARCDPLCVFSQNALPESNGNGTPTTGTEAGQAQLHDTQLYDISSNTGNKKILESGDLRMEAFAEWCFKQRNVNTEGKDCIILGGHSLWFKHFFQVYLPKLSQHRSKRRKMQNAAIIAFHLHRGIVTKNPGKQCPAYAYRIDERSITPIYLNFT